VANQLTTADEDINTSFESRLDGETLQQLLTSLQLIQDNSVLRHAIDVLCQAHANLSERLTFRDSEIALLQSCHNDLNVQATELSGKVSLLEQELAEFKDSSQCARHSDLTAQNTDLQHELELVEKEHSNLQLSVNEKADRGNGAIQGRLLCLQHQHQRQLQSTRVVEEKFEVMQQHCDQLTTALTDERDKMQLLTDQLLEQQTKVMAQQTEVVAASARNSDLSAQNADLQHQLELLEKECSNLQLSLDEFHEKADSEQRELRDQIVCLQNECQLHLQSTKVGEEKLEVLQQHCEQLITALSDERDKMQLLREQLSEEQSKMMSQQKEVEAASARNIDLTAQNTDLQQKLELVEKECCSLQLSLGELRDKKDGENEELRDQLLCLQNEYQLQSQSLKVNKEKHEVLQQHCDQLIMENADLKLQVREGENKQAELQAMIDELKQSLQHNEKVLTESKNVAEECLCEKTEVQKQLLNAEKERNDVCAELSDISVQLLELQARHAQRNEQIEEKDHDLNRVRQQIADIIGEMLALQQMLQQEQTLKTERKQQVKKLKKEIKDLKETVASQNRAVADALVTKEDTDKQTSSLQLQTEHLTSEKFDLEQQVRILQDHNSSLQKDHTAITESYETAKKQSAELELRVNQLCHREQSLSEQLEQKAEVIRQLISAKEEVSHTLAAMTLKAHANALERTAHVNQISELEEQIGTVKDHNERLSAEKQVLLDDVSMHKELSEQLKQSFSDSERENERCQKVISDFEEQWIHWKDEKLNLESRIITLQNCATDMEKEIQTLRKNQNVERTSIRDLPLVRSTEVEASDSSDHHKREKCEFIQTLKTVEQKSEETEIEQFITSACKSVYNVCSEQDSENMREYQSLSINVQDTCGQCETEKDGNCCMKNTKEQLGSFMKGVSFTVEQPLSSENEFECDMQAKVHKIHSSEKCSSETDKGNLQSVLLENAVTRANTHFEMMVEGNVATADASYNFSGKSIAKESSDVDKNKQCSHNVVTNFERSLAPAVDPLVKTERDCGSTVADTASKHEKRRVIKRFTRLPKSSAALRHERNPSYVHSKNVPNFSTEAACSQGLSAPVEAVELLSNNKSFQSNEASASAVSESATLKLQENTGSIPVSVSVTATSSSTDECSATVAVGNECPSACEQPGYPQAISGLSQFISGRCKQDNNENLNTVPECTDTLNTIASSVISSDNKSKLALHVSNKRLNTDMNGVDAKKLRSG